MLSLHPYPDVQFDCPHCQERLTSQGWYMPGMRVLADLQCERCQREYYGDLPTGHGLCFPMLLDKSTGEIHDRYHAAWFADWLRDSYRDRHSTPLKLTIEERRSIRKPLLLNCLDTLYGHSLLKLADAQYYLDHHPDFDLIVLVPRPMRWMVPEDVAAIWTIDLPFKQGTEWNDWLAQAVHQRLSEFDQAWLATAYSHSHAGFEVERFTQTPPFPLDQWDDRMQQLTVTFIWREDRFWLQPSKPPRYRRLDRWITRTQQKLGLYRSEVAHQAEKVVELAQGLRTEFPTIEVAIAGIGTPGNLPEWITDLRTRDVTEEVEKRWCQLYARSQVVIGVHGSNMLLPSAHAGTVIELVPSDRWGNLMQDMLLIPNSSSKEGLFRYRLIPIESSPSFIAEMIVSLVQTLPFAMLYLQSPQDSQDSSIANLEGVAQQYRQVRLNELARMGKV